MNMRFISPY